MPNGEAMQEQIQAALSGLSPAEMKDVLQRLLAKELQRAQQPRQAPVTTAEEAQQGDAAAQQARLPDLTQPLEGHQEPTTEAGPTAPPPAPNGTDADHEPPVPKWVY